MRLVISPTRRSFVKMNGQRHEFAEQTPANIGHGVFRNLGKESTRGKKRKFPAVELLQTSPSAMMLISFTIQLDLPMAASTSLPVISGKTMNVELESAKKKKPNNEPGFVRRARN
jgi:hypothetical protein